MSDSGWIKCSDRMPTVEDSDYSGCVWVCDKDMPLRVSWNHARNYSYWKPTGILLPDRPEPEQPERIEGWVNVYPEPVGYCGFYFDRDEAVRQSCVENRHRTAHVREVLPGDPDPDKVRQVVEEVESELQPRMVADDFTVRVSLQSLRNWRILLGGAE